ncbi:MAG: hypothetical protein JJ916_09335 [Phycisphaerales bacterium]|nr:hypothetical protein [Phycisphaerales bacterium]
MTHATRRLSLSITCAVLLCVCSSLQARVYHVYYLGGQSNMDGFGQVGDLSDAQREPVERCVIFHGNNQNAGDTPRGLGIWATLTPGHGVGFGSSGKANRLSDRFGPELTFGRTMRERFPDRNIAIIKFSRGGSTIAGGTGSPCWDPHDTRTINGNVGTNQYDFALKTIDNAMRARDIDGDGEDDTLIPAGIVWMQGESDATQQGPAGRYFDNLSELMELFRAAMRADGLPVVIGRISDSNLRDGDQPVWRFGDQVRAAQKRFCDTDPNALLVTSTDGYGYSDPYHYDSEGYLDLGERFAGAMHALETGKADD